MNEMQSVSLGVWIGIGGRYETNRQSGISHVVEHMLFKGTHSRSATDLKESIEGVGGAFNGFTSDEITCYMVKVPAKHFRLGMDVLADMVVDPKFDETDLAREKFVIIEEIKMYRDQPSDHVMDLLANLMWPANALGRPLTGTTATVKSLTRKDLVEFKENYYHPSNIAVVAAGRIDPDKVRDYAAEKFLRVKKGGKGSVKRPSLNQSAPRIKFAHGETKQTHIAMGFPVPDADIHERFALKMMNIILGGNMSSRLFEQLREKYGLCYDISSAYKRHSDIGELHVHAGVDTKKALKAVTAILDEIKKLKDLGVTEDELSRAKEFAKGQFLLAMEGTSTRMIWLGDRYMLHKHIPAVSDVIKWIDDVTSRGVREISNKVFRKRAINLAVVGKLGKHETNLIRKEFSTL